MDIRDGIVAVLTEQDEIAGTGFLAARNLILTCAHVVGSATQLRVKFVVDGSSYSAEVQVLSPKEALDLAALRISATPAGAQVLPLGVPAGAVGRDFHAFGYAIVGHVQGVGARGQVVDLVDEARWLQLRSQDIDHGMSGGPVVDESQGGVIGMVSWGKTSEYRRTNRNDDTSFALSMDTVRQLCPELKLREGCPYRGLQLFQEEDAELYFGRERASAELVDWLARRDFVALVGVSGSGKSSLVRAGLARALQEHPLPGLAERPRITFAPGRLPLLNLLPALAYKLGTERIAETLEIPLDLWSDREALASALAARPADQLARSMRKLAPPSGLLLIADQFERLYTECLDLEARNQFIETLLALAGEQVKVLLTLRADFYASLMEHAGLLEQVRDGLVHLLAMTADELRQAIERPARSWGRSLQDGLAERLARDVQGRAGDLPLLQFALTELWAQDAAGGMLKLSSYEGLGYSDGTNVFPGVQGAVAKRAEQVWQGFDPGEQQAARRIFLRLASASDPETRGGGAVGDASRRAWLAELDGEARAVVAMLVEARLLASGQDAASGQPTLEVAHESLLRAWPRLARWLTDTRPFLQWYENDLAPFLHNWLQNDRKPGYLLSAAMLDEARTWLGKYPEELDGPAREFIEGSVVEQERQRKAREQLRHRIILGLVIGLLVTLFLSLLSVFQWKRADQQAAIARTQERAAQIQSDINHARELRARSLLEMQSNAECAVGLSLLAYNRARDISGLPLAEFEDAVRETLRHAHTRAVLVGHAAIVNSVAWTSDGKRVATASDDGTVKIWDSSTGQLLKTLEGTSVRVMSVAWSPDGIYLAAAGAGNIFIWNAASFEKIAETWGHSGLVRGLDWSVDGRLASGGDDGVIKVWEYPFQQPLKTLTGHSAMIYGLDFAPDGRQLASVSADYTVMLWDTESGTSTAASLTTQPLQVSWAPSGSQLVVGTADGMARLFDTFSGWPRETKSWPAHNAGTKSVDWSASGKFIATGSDDGTIRIWDAETQSQLYEFSGHADVIFDVSWSPDNKTVASASGDGTARLWVLEPSSSLRFNYSPAYLMDVAWAPDGRYLALASSSALEGYQIRVLDTSTWSESTYDPGHSGSILRLSWHPTRQVIASSGADNTIVLFDLARNERLLSLSGHSEVVYGVDWSPDGLRLVSGGDVTVRIWDAITGANIDTLSGHTNNVNDVDWHPSAERLASISGDGTVRLWDLNTPANNQTLENQGVIGVRVRWDPEGNRLLSGWSNGTVIVWDAGTGKRLLEIGGHSGPVWATAWSPDGKSFAAGYVDGSIIIFDAQTGDKIATIQGHQGTIRGLDWSPDGTQLASVGELDGTLQVDSVQFTRILALAAQQIKRGLTSRQYSDCTSDQ